MNHPRLTRPIVTLLTLELRRPCLIVRGCAIIFCIVFIAPLPTRGAATSQPASAPVDERAQLPLAEIGDPPSPASPRSRPAAGLSDAARRQLRIARDRMAEKAWAEAASALERLIENEPEWVEARTLAAQVAIQRGDMSEAKSHLNEALSLDPQHLSAHRLLGEIEQSQGRTQKAITAYRAALASPAASAKDPQTLLTQLGLGLLLKREGYFRAAADALDVFASGCDNPTPEMTANADLAEAMRLYRDRLPAMLGECRLKSGDYAKAVPPLRAALKAAPDNNATRNDLTLALARSGQADEALDLAREAALAKHCSRAALAALKDACDSTGSKDAFSQQLAKLIESVEQPDALTTLADVALDHGDARIAELSLAKILETSPDQADAHVRLARLRIKSPAPQFLGALAAALTHAPELGDQIDLCIQDAVADGRGDELLHAARKSLAEKTNPAISYIAGRIRLESGHPDDAAADFEAMLAADKSNLSAYAGLMAARMRQFRWADAISVGESALQEELSSAQLHLLLGRAYAAMDEHEKAEAAFLESFAQSRKDSTPLRELAELLERQDDARRCEEIYRRIVNEVNPRDAVAREALVRLYLIGDDPKAAKKYFADFAELGQKGPIVDSTAALLDFATIRDGDGRARLEKYRATLRKISEAHPTFVPSRFDLAMSYIRFAKYHDAMKWADDALSINPADIKSLELKAQLQSRLLDFDGSLQTWKQLLKHRPRSAAWLGQLVEAYVTLADFESAAALLRELMARKDLATLHERYARILMAALAAGGHRDQALALARERLKADPADITRRGRLLFELGQSGLHDEAIETARSFLEKDPLDETYRTLLIERLDKAKRYTEAQAQILTWLGKSPEDPILNRYLVIMHWRVKNWDGAIELCQASSETAAQREDNQQLLAQTLLLAGRYDSAIALLESLTEGKLGAPLEAAQVDLIIALTQAERYNEAEKAVLRIIGPQIDDRRPRNNYDPRQVIRFRGLLSNIYQATGRMEDAYEQLVEIRRINSADPEANNNLAYTWSEGGANLDKAEKYVRIALAEEPRNAAYLDTLGWVLYKRGKFDEAIKWLKLAMKQQDEPDPVMLTHLGDALARTGDTSAAEPLWRQAHELIVEDKEENRTFERKALRKSLQVKMEALRGGKPVPTAPLPAESIRASSKSTNSQPTED